MKELHLICLTVKTLLLREDETLVEVPAPAKVFGDIHGQIVDLVQFFRQYGAPSHRGGDINICNYIFAGDFVDRGKQSIETMCLLLAYKIKYPNMIFLLRGNHECNSITRMYGFYDECKRRYNLALWRDFCTMISHLPISSIIDERIMCKQGGLSPDLNHLS